MKRVFFSGKTLLLIIIVVTLLGLPRLVLAQVGYNLDWFTVDAGSGLAIGGNYLLYGSIGQYEAGNLSGGSYGLSGGFWNLPVTGNSTTLPQYQLYLPVVMRH